jgi:hypothetical protein
MFKYYDKSIIIAFIAIIIIPYNSYGWDLFDYKDYNNCILQNVKEGLSDEALLTVKEVCHNKFPTIEKIDAIDKEPTPCYLVYNGKQFVRGKASELNFKRISIERYGIKAIEWAIPNKMYKYLNENKELDLFKGKDKLSKFLRDNFAYSKRLCGFND